MIELAPEAPCGSCRPAVVNDLPFGRYAICERALCAEVKPCVWRQGRSIRAVGSEEISLFGRMQRRVLEDRGERLADTVDLVAAVELDVLLRDFPVQRQVTRCPSWSHPKVVRQVWVADSTHEVQAKVDVRQALALGMAQTLLIHI